MTNALQTLDQAKNVASKMFNDPKVESVVVQMFWGKVEIDRNFNCREHKGE